MNVKLNTIEEAIEDFRNGKLIIVVDDQDRENEGDFIGSAEKITPETVNFMTKYGRGLMCAPLTAKRADELNIPLMVDDHDNTDLHKTAFTVTVDRLGDGVTTGISAFDRAKTLNSLADPQMTPGDFSRPGHISPLIAREGGVLYRTGHTEAAVDMARLAGLKPAGVLIEIMNEDGTMARLPQLLELSKKFGIKIISIEALVAYRMAHDPMVVEKERLEITDSASGAWNIRIFEDKINHARHIALTKGSWTDKDTVTVKVSRIDPVISAVNFIDPSVLSSQKITSMIKDKGAIILITSDNNSYAGKSIEAKDLAVPTDQKIIGIGASIIGAMGIRNLKLISRSSSKRVGLSGYGLNVTEVVSY